jgi:hypothetical protein
MCERIVASQHDSENLKYKQFSVFIRTSNSLKYTEFLNDLKQSWNIPL